MGNWEWGIGNGSGVLDLWLIFVETLHVTSLKTKTTDLKHYRQIIESITLRPHQFDCNGLTASTNFLA